MCFDYRNLATNLVKHERIYTTWHKALELRKYMEKFIRQVRTLDSVNARRKAFQTLYENPAQKRLFEEILPRFDDMGLQGGYTNIAYIGQRTPDGAKLGMIELLGNAIQDWEKKQEMKDAENLGRPTFYEWEHKIIKQEQ